MNQHSAQRARLAGIHRMPHLNEDLAGVRSRVDLM